MKKNIGIIGIGRLGLPLALNFERAGFKVLGCDIREDYVNDINNKSFKTIEPDVEDMLKLSNNFEASTSLEYVFNNSDIIFLCLRTETNMDGSYDVSQVDSVVNDLKNLAIVDKNKLLVVNCNVNPGYTNSVRDRLANLGYSVNYNPEWVAQGTIVRDQIHPDVIVIGEENIESGEQLLSCYKSLCLSDPKIFRMDVLSAEITKIALNCFLTCKISYANMIGDLAKKVGADENKILSAVGADSRIGNKFFNYGYGYGGPCFPRDTRAYLRYSKDNHMDAIMVDAAQKYNQIHFNYYIEDFVSQNSKNEPVLLDGVCYKKGVDIIESSQQLDFAVELANRGYKVTIKDYSSVIAQIKDIYLDLFDYECY
tara:strand:- start:26286 stop:27389 length:1104 start_codon:yes stop_codon:yes gene_type:complete